MENTADFMKNRHCVSGGAVGCPIDVSKNKSYVLIEVRDQEINRLTFYKFLIVITRLSFRNIC